MHVRSIPERRLARIRGRARAACERAAAAPIRRDLSRKSPAPVITGSASIGPDRRQSRRIATQSAVLVRRIGAFNFSVALTDISTGGCRVELLEPSAVGDPVVARLPQLEPLGSRVCWADGTTTGVQFLRAIHPAVFDMLLTRLANDASDEAAVLD